MFSGLVQAMGVVASVERHGLDRRFVVSVPAEFDADEVALGDSIAHAGVCLTVVGKQGQQLAYDVSTETLSRTTLGAWQVGTRINLEKSLRLSDRLGGHLVSGHVDGVGALLQLSSDARAHRLRFRMPSVLARFVAEKGSIAVDGVSLTVNAVGPDWFEVALIPHTWNVTTLGALTVGSEVNLEVDQIARYIDRMRQVDG